MRVKIQRLNSLIQTDANIHEKIYDVETEIRLGMRVVSNTKLLDKLVLRSSTNFKRIVDFVIKNKINSDDWDESIANSYEYHYEDFI